MESTGIVRRFDELGRIVIPKACRKAIGLDVYEGVPMEIFVNENCEIVLRPYGINKAREHVLRPCGINETREHGAEFLNALTEIPFMASDEELDAIRNILSRLTPACRDD